MHVPPPPHTPHPKGHYGPPPKPKHKKKKHHKPPHPPAPPKTWYPKEKHTKPPKKEHVKKDLTWIPKKEPKEHEHKGHYGARPPSKLWLLTSRFEVDTPPQHVPVALHGGISVSKRKANRQRSKQL